MDDIILNNSDWSMKKVVDFLISFCSNKKKRKNSHRDIAQCGRPNVMIHKFKYIHVRSFACANYQVQYEIYLY
jgi:hypothetical protein